MFAFITGGYSTKAKRTDNAFVLSYPDALKPGVYRVDLNEAQNLIFEIKEDKGGFHLIEKKGKSQGKVIATYSTRPKAVGALMKTTKVLSKKKGFRIPVIKILIGIVILYLIGQAYNFIQLNGIPTFQSENIDVSQEVKHEEKITIPQTNPNDIGVPVSADDYLNSLDKAE